MKEVRISINGQERYVRYNDLPGEKIPLVFIPGWACAGSFDFVECASQAGLKDHRRILIDLLGRGYSDRPLDFDYLPESHSAYIGEIIKSLKLDEFIIYAHSLGGRIALDLAKNFKATGKLKGLILCEGSMIQESFPYMEDGEEFFVDKHYKKMLGNLARKKDQQFLATARLASPQAMFREAQELINPKSSKWEDMFFSATYKKVFIFGENTRDDGFDLDNIKNQKDIKLIEVKSASHTMNWEMPKRTSLAILEGIKYR